MLVGLNQSVANKTIAVITTFASVAANSCFVFFGYKWLFWYINWFACAGSNFSELN
jgi:hypothetical protein